MACTLPETKGICRPRPPGLVCAGGSCAVGVAQTAATCDGLGTCRPGSAKRCAPYQCGAASCLASCKSNADCMNGSTCAPDGTCAGLLPSGTACSKGTQCSSGTCVQGVCCETACDKVCYACNVSGAAGVCTPVADGADPADQCAEESSACGHDGKCDGRGGCRFRAAGTSCAAPACSAATLTEARVCDGAGSCAPGASRSWLGGCSAGACKACAAAADCPARFLCAGGVCTPDGLALYWKLDETSGTVAQDASGNGLSGEYLTAPSASTDVPRVPFPDARSHTFAIGAGQGLRLATIPTALRSPGAVTMTIWFKTRRLDARGSELISVGDNYTLRLYTNTLFAAKRVTPSNYVTCSAKGPVLDGAWHHAALVLSATDLHVYLDGVDGCAVSDSRPINDYGNGLSVGRHAILPSGFDFEGNLDDARIYGRALSPQELAAIRGTP